MPASPASPSAAPCILVVEDEFLIRLTLTEVLTEEGYRVLEAETGEEALDLVAGNPGLAMLLTDIQLAGSMDGRTLVERVRSVLPALPVIFTTGRPDAELGRSTREMQIAKPYLPSEICTAVRTMLAG